MSNDYLDRDPSVRKQKYVCISILTPNDIDVRGKSYYEARAFALSLEGLFKDKEDYNGKFKAWLATTQIKLDDEYAEISKHKPHVPIAKVRGSYPSHDDAVARCQFLSKKDKLCDIYVTEVGTWFPIDGKHRESTEVVYAEKQMQNLMKSRQEQAEKAKEQFEARVQEAREAPQKEKKEVEVDDKKEEDKTEVDV